MSNYEQRTTGDVTYLFPLTVGGLVMCFLFDLPIQWAVYAAAATFFGPLIISTLKLILSFIKMVEDAIDKKAKQ